jgi:hypothetical protein
MTAVRRGLWMVLLALLVARLPGVPAAAGTSSALCAEIARALDAMLGAAGGPRDDDPERNDQ